MRITLEFQNTIEEEAYFHARFGKPVAAVAAAEVEPLPPLNEPAVQVVQEPAEPAKVKRTRRTKAEMQAEAHTVEPTEPTEAPAENAELDYQNDVRPLLTQLHTKLGGPAQFTTWTRENVTSLGLIEGIDWKTLKPADYAQAIALLKGALA